MIENEELRILNIRKQGLQRKESKGEISDKDYQSELDEIESKRKIIIHDYINNDIQKRQERNKSLALIKQQQKVNENMAKEKVEKKDKPESYTRLILKALMMKSTKNADEVADKALEWRPGRDRKAVLTQTKTIVYLIANQKGKRWEAYDFNKDAYLVTEKEQ